MEQMCKENIILIYYNNNMNEHCHSGVKMKIKTWIRVANIIKE
jgi:hypothetical protein